MAAFPAVVLLGLWFVKRLDLFMTVLLIAVPLSLNLQEFSYTLPGLYMPTEPMLMGLLVLFTFRAFSGAPIDKRLLTHPMTLLIGGMMVWMMIATATSSHPLVSIKFLYFKNLVYRWLLFVLRAHPSSQKELQRELCDDAIVSTYNSDHLHSYSSRWT